MTRKSLAACCLVLFGSVPMTLPAQVPLPRPSFGLLGAVNVASLSGGSVVGYANHVAFSVGGFARIPLASSIAFQPELEYAAKGAEETVTSGGSTSKGTLDLRYLEMPLLLRFTAESSPALKLFGELGPAFAARLDCTFSGTSGGLTISFACSEVGNVKSLDVGAMAGAGVEVPLGTHALSLGVRYNLGLTEITTGSNVKNRNLQFVAAWRF